MLIFTAFTVTVQAAPPLPRQAAGTSSDSGNQNEQNAKDKNDATANPAPSHPTDATHDTSDETSKIENQNTHNSETLTRITGLPVVAIADKKKTCIDYLFDWGPWVFSAVLVIVGIVGVIAAFLTLGAIRDQANRMQAQVDRMDTQVTDARKTAADSTLMATKTLAAIEKQADLMEQQTKVLETQAKATDSSVAAAIKAADASQSGVEALVNSERAWIIVNKTDWPSKYGWYFPEFPQYRPGMAFLFEVSGKTVARITDSVFVLASFPARPGTMPLEPELQVVPDYTIRSRSPEIPEDGRIVTPGQKFQIMVGLSRDLAKDEWESMRDGKTLMCAYGKINYESLGKDCETAVCYIFRFHGGVITATDGTVLNPDGFEVGGPRAYNRHT
jgi:hypothetical protein